MELGKLSNGGQAAPISVANAAPRCGARTKSTGLPCKRPALRGRSRCKLHGGLSTGAKTPEGKARQRIAATKQGLYAGPGHPLYGPEPGPRWRGHGKLRKELGIKLKRKSGRKQLRDRKTGRFLPKDTPIAFSRD